MKNENRNENKEKLSLLFVNLTSCFNSYQILVFKLYRYFIFLILKID